MHRLRPERAIKLDRWLVPIEHSPFHPAAAAVPRDLCQLNKQRATVSFAAVLRLHEQIFKIKPGSPQPCGKIVKVNCEPDRRVSFKCEMHISSGFDIERNINKLFFGRGGLVPRVTIPSALR